jgi:RNA-binding protein NOB1
LKETSLDECDTQEDDRCAQELKTTEVESEAKELEPIASLEDELSQVQVQPSKPIDPTPVSNQSSSNTLIYDDPSDEDDGEGDWITPSNIAIHKSRALDLLPHTGLKGKGGEKQVPIGSGCMTADFAMQNVLLQMGLNLVGLEGKRIEKIKSWVLRCHACFKYDSLATVSFSTYHNRLQDL